MHWFTRIGLAAVTASMGAPGAQAGDADALRINQIQVIGTHNSYHLRPPAELLAIVRQIVPDARAWDYEHKPLPEQLADGVRSFELDLYHYPGGWEVFHVPHYDERSSCPMFVDCLRQVKAWSDANPRHVPVSFLLEIKEEEARVSPRPVAPLDAEALDRLDAEIRSVFPDDRIITPDSVRGDAPTLVDAIRDHGWPRLGNSRGKVMFILHERGFLRDLYTDGRDSLRGRAMFVNSAPGRDDGVTMVMDNPLDANIPDRVRAGVFVRTRIDAGLREPEPGDTRRRDQGFASGAHILTSDFPPGTSNSATGYTVSFEGNAPARVNPVNTPAELHGIALE